MREEKSEAEQRTEEWIQLLNEKNHVFNERKKLIEERDKRIEQLEKDGLQILRQYEFNGVNTIEGGLFNKAQQVKCYRNCSANWFGFDYKKGNTYIVEPKDFEDDPKVCPNDKTKLREIYERYERSLEIPNKITELNIKFEKDRDEISRIYDNEIAKLSDKIDIIKPQLDKLEIYRPRPFRFGEPEFSAARGKKCEGCGKITYRSHKKLDFGHWGEVIKVYNCY